MALGFAARSAARSSAFADRPCLRKLATPMPTTGASDSASQAAIANLSLSAITRAPGSPVSGRISANRPWPREAANDAQAPASPLRTGQLGCELLTKRGRVEDGGILRVHNLHIAIRL